MAIINGRRCVVTVGEPVQIHPGSQIATHIDIFALDSNTGRVYVGDSLTRASSGQQCGWPLSAKEAVTFQDIVLSTIWIDAAVAGEGVSWGAEL